ncbi:MAG: tetratricopeptide repeat protein [bacterium]|nr:tetratricopeptide repeat protein [bacterium]
MDRAYETAKAINYEKGIAYCLFGSTFRFLINGDYEKALEVCREAREIFAKIRHPIGESRVLTQMGNVYRTPGNLDVALSLFIEAGDILKKSQDEEAFLYIDAKAWNLDGIASIYYDLGDLDYAVRYYRESLPLFPPM